MKWLSNKVVIRNNHNVDLSILWDFGVCTLLGVVHIVEIRKISFGVWFLLWVLKCIYERSCTWVLHDKLDWVGERRYFKCKPEYFGGWEYVKILDGRLTCYKKIIVVTEEFRHDVTLFITKILLQVCECMISIQ